MLLAHTISIVESPVPAIDPAFTPWTDPAATIASFVDTGRQTSLALCAPRARAIRLIFDLRKQKTRVWLPAWQFHSTKGDGTTPPAERRVKMCVTRAIQGWSPPVLPQAMAEIHAIIDVNPTPATR
jgi:hypothetical protein